MASQPGLAPPPGVMPDFASPYTLEPYQVLTAAECAIVTTLLVAARMYIKYAIIKKVVLEDCEIK